MALEPYNMTPTDIREFNLDWSQEIGSAIIVNSSWSCNLSGPTISGDAIGPSNTSSSTTVATVPSGNVYTITNTILASDGQDYSESFSINGVSYNYL